ncbi:hypothetical protein MUO83_00985 [Candidatus Bathyarchaeota archaeon]|nr:hypothetical protein [Candidatus Bathyarchaeota archaeon]
MTSSIFIGVKPGWASESIPEEKDVLAMSTVERVLLSGNGNARLMIQTELDDGPLADIYRKALAAPSNATIDEEMLIPESKSSEIQIGQNTTRVTLPVRSIFYKGVKDEQLSSFGLATKILNSSMVPNSSTGSFTYSVDAVAFPQVTSVTGSGSNYTWKIRVGPKNENAARKAVGYDLTKVAFAQSMLRSREGEQRYESFLTMTIVLPEGATLINANELEGLNWTVSFGGGTYMTASLSIDTSSRIILNEELSVAEQNLTATTNELYSGLSDFGVFEIKYLQPQWASDSPEAGLDVSNELTDDFSYDRTFPVFFISATLPLIDDDPVHVSLTATVEVTLAWYIGWDFGWVEHTGLLGFKYWLYEPTWFETWISPQVSVNVSLEAGVSKVYSREWDIENLIEPVRIPFEFYYGILVWGDFEFSVKARVTFDAQAEASVKIEACASAGFKAGLKWDRENGWSGIWEPAFSADYTGPVVSVEAKASATAGLGFGFALLIYDTVGPAVEFWLYAKGTMTFIPVVSWDLSLHFKIEAGIKFGVWLHNLLGLSDQLWTLFDQTLYEWGGHLGVVSSEISVNVRPSTISPGSPVTVYGSISSQYPGDKSGTVQVKYSTDNAEWTDLGSASSDASGYYSYSAVLDSEGVYYVRSSWNGNPQYYGATSSPFYPLNVQTSIIFLGFFQTVSLSSNSIATGQNVVVSSQLYYVLLGSKQEYQKNEGIVTLQLSADGTLWQNISSGTPHNGYYYGNWIPSNAGTYCLRATYEGQWTVFRLELMSPAASLEVVQAETSLNMSLSTTSMKYGQKVTITTSMSPSVEEKTVKFEYSFGDSNWYFLSAGNTDSAGQYAFSWAPGVGEYNVRSVWAGDESYFGAESATWLLTVVQPSQYSLSVISPYNTVSGMGLYDVNATAYATLSEGTYDIIPGAVRAIFTGWAGDADGSDLTSDPITMDGPKTAIATWEIQLYTRALFEYDTLNLKSRGDWVTAYVELPEGYDVNNIDISTIKLNETIPAELEPVAFGDYDNDRILDLAVRFNRTLLVKYLISKGIASGNVTLTITGLSALEKTEHTQPATTVAFEGSTTIKVSSLVGDVNCDGTVNIFDATLVLQCYGSKEGSPNWNPNANFAEEWDRINLYDVITLIYHYGQTSP